jgi:chorismate mutase
MELETHRKKIDEIDTNLMKLLADRDVCVREIAAYKRAHDMPYSQPERELAILATKKSLAEKLHLDPEFVERLFAVIFEYSKKTQAQV